MEQKHRDAIRANFVSLVEQTDLDFMVSALFEKGVFSEQMIEKYNDTSRIQRERKQQFYLDIMRRGPRAFAHLLDALTEAGYWDIVRDLDPSRLRTPSSRSGPSSSHSLPPLPRDDNYLSISKEKRKAMEENQSAVKQSPPEPPNEPDQKPEPPVAAPSFTVLRSTAFIEKTKDNLEVYRTRARCRGVLLMFNYMSFDQNIEEYRAGVEVDCANLKHLFDELGFKVIVYPDYTTEDTKRVLQSLENKLAGAECVFVVVSSHGYRSPVLSDTDVRCSDGGLLSLYDFIEHFNNRELPALLGVPKVFIFQVCRGDNEQWSIPRPPRMRPPGAGGRARGQPPPRASLTQVDGTVDYSDDYDNQPTAVYSDILIAHSTLPGFKSHRDTRLGSWYIQVLCEVFAARAHNCDVDTLFRLVDQEMSCRFRCQTSSVDRWGFNRMLYLHPGLYET